MKKEWPKKIIHIDMDAFFAAVEQRDNPKLRGKPLIVGGDPFGRGVVSTCSYEARKFGVRSAMSAAEAKRLCPQGIFIRPNFDKYQEASARVFSILRQHTDLVEPLSLDEAYLDVTRHRLGMEDPVMIAKVLKQNIFAVTKLTASAGVAPNLFLAKIASDMKKPDGLTVVSPEGIKDFLKDLPVRKIPGVGPVTENGLKKHGILKCGDILEKEIGFLIREFGKWGLVLHQRARGVDNRQVEPESAPKQVSSEETFVRDMKDMEWLKARISGLSKEVFLGLSESGYQGRTVVLKVKYFDFEKITRSCTLNHEVKSEDEIYRTALDLFEKKTLAGKKAIRLLGVGISGLEEKRNLSRISGDLFTQ